MAKRKEPDIADCPFCGCTMGYLYLGGGYEWFGRHKSMCPLEGNPSGSYGRLKDMVKAWSKREG